LGLAYVVGGGLLEGIKRKGLVRGPEYTIFVSLRRLFLAEGGEKGLGGKRQKGKASSVKKKKKSGGESKRNLVPLRGQKGQLCLPSLERRKE